MDGITAKVIKNREFWNENPSRKLTKRTWPVGKSTRSKRSSRKSRLKLLRCPSSNDGSFGSRRKLRSFSTRCLGVTRSVESWCWKSKLTKCRSYLMRCCGSQSEVTFGKWHRPLGRASQPAQTRIGRAKTAEPFLMKVRRTSIPSALTGNSPVWMPRNNSPSSGDDIL